MEGIALFLKQSVISTLIGINLLLRLVAGTGEGASGGGDITVWQMH